MTIFEQLAATVRRQETESELPVWLVPPLLAVAENPERYAGKEYLVEMLLAQVNEYDPYAEAGCCKWAYDEEDLKRTLRWLHE